MKMIAEILVISVVIAILVVPNIYLINEDSKDIANSFKNETKITVLQISIENISIHFHGIYQNGNRANKEEVLNNMVYNKPIGWFSLNGNWVVENNKYIQKDESDSWHFSYLKNVFTNYQVSVEEIQSN